MKMEHEELTRKVIGCCFKVYNTLGYGFLESVYQKSLMIELRTAGLSAEMEVAIPVSYEGEPVGDFSADIVVDDVVILELKSVRQLTDVHEVQLVNYLKATGKQVGLLINFGEKKVEVRRKLKTLPSSVDVLN